MPGAKPCCYLHRSVLVLLVNQTPAIALSAEMKREKKISPPTIQHLSERLCLSLSEQNHGRKGAEAARGRDAEEYQTL